MDAVFRLLYYSEQYPKNTAMNHAMLTLCHHLEQVPEQTIEELAQLCNTNPMMLSRIARKLSYRNFAEFRSAVQDTLAQRRYQNRNIPMDFVDPAAPADSFLQYAERLIAQLRAPEVGAGIDAVCSAMHEARQIHVYGPPHLSVYTVMLLHDLISDGKKIHPYTSKESILLDLDSVAEDSLVFLVPNDLVIDEAFAQRILETVERKRGRLVVHAENGCPLLGFTSGPNLSYPGDRTAANVIASFFVLNMLTMTYRNRYFDSHGGPSALR